MHTWEAFLEEAVPKLQMRLHLTFEGGRAFLAEGTSAGQEATGGEGGLGGRCCTQGPMAGTLEAGSDGAHAASPSPSQCVTEEGDRHVDLYH